MAINSTNINKTNNHLSSQFIEHKKESLNSNGHQFHQYQQNKQVDIGGIDDHYCLNFLYCGQ
jgi:hypothetical protein